MRALLIGGNGFIGTPLARELMQGGHQVAVLHRGVASSAAEPSDLEIQGDRNRLADCEAEIRKFAPHVIVDLILSSGDQAENVAALSRGLHARLVALSSGDVYRAWGVMHGTEPGDLEPVPITEDSALRTVRDAYPPELVKALKNIFTWLSEGYDKVAVEHAVMTGGPDNTVLRLPMVYGPGDPLHRMHGVLKRIADGRATIILADDHAPWRAPRGYVDNVAHAIALAALSDRACGRIYNVCEEPCLSELHWEQRMAAEAGWNGKFIVMPRERTPKHLLAIGNPRQHVVVDSTRIRKELGYDEPVAVDEAIRRTIAWERANVPTAPGFHRFDYEAEDRALAAIGE